VGIEVGEEIQAKGIDTILNKIIAKISPILKKTVSFGSRMFSEEQTAKKRKSLGIL
jgi:hypothetical protein